MKFWVKILIVFCVLVAGNPLRDYLVNKIAANSVNNNISQIQKSLYTAPEISIWGSSTAYMNFNAEAIQEYTKKTTYCFGISGAYYNQLHHLISFASKNENKTMIWIVNPYEFMEDQSTKLQENNYFTPFVQDAYIHRSMYPKSIILEQKYFGWLNIFHFNATHWGSAFASNVKHEFNSYGNHFARGKFKDDNNFYRTPEKVKYSSQKIAEFNKIIEQIKKKNVLTIVFPPTLKKINFTAFKNEIATKVIDYSNFCSDSLAFHDHIHLNEKYVKSITLKLVKDLNFQSK